MYAFLIGLHLLISAALVIVVLLQAGRGGGLAGVFGGGGGSQTVFGGRGAASFLSKATAVLGAAFMLSALTLAVLSSRRGPARAGRSVIEDVIRREGAEQPGEATSGPVPEGGLQEPTAPAGEQQAPAAGVVPSEVLPSEDRGQEQSEEQKPTSP
ncbi:MAG: preprotein translocase subunit SecG [Candidatus Eiseniibacteriota bacterium]|nr:MAG: preprotein translocase subunit SecG [Candidatus Eisenbacteria bacterium]